MERHDIFKNAQVNAMEARRREILGSVDRAKVENYYRIDSIVVRPPWNENPSCNLVRTIRGVTRSRREQPRYVSV